MADLLRQSIALCRAKLRAKIRRENELEQMRNRYYARGRSDRGREFTRLIDPGGDDCVWLTPKPDRDLIEVRPPTRIPLSASIMALRLDEAIRYRPVRFRPRIIAECYDGVQYRQALWERVR